jgi:hypothetical protein
MAAGIGLDARSARKKNPIHLEKANEIAGK